MKKCALLLVTMLVSLGAFSQAAPAKSSGTKASSSGGAAGAIEKADKDRMAAIVKGDMDAVDKSTADTYVFTDGNGRVTSKSELMDQLKSGALKVASQTISDVKVNMYGNTAVETGKLVGKTMRDGKDQSGTYRFTRVWVNQGGTWKTVALQETKAQ
jgi:ketosteroid isomerase-like protein